MSWANKTRGAKKATAKVVKMVVNCMIVGREKVWLVKLEVIDEVNTLRVSRAFLTVYLYFSSSGDF